MEDRLSDERIEALRRSAARGLAEAVSWIRVQIHEELFPALDEIAAGRRIAARLDDLVPRAARLADIVECMIGDILRADEDLPADFPRMERAMRALEYGDIGRDVLDRFRELLVRLAAAQQVDAVPTPG